MAKYRFGKLLDEGTFGEVWEVTCLDDNWKGVAKRLKETENERSVARFSREVRLQSQLSHPGIMRIRATSLESERPWFAMERADSNLRDYVTSEPCGEHLLPIFTAVARAVEYAHANGIIHRDLKPENILLMEDPFEDIPIPIVSDFGLGRHIDRATLTLTQTAIGVGTYAYASPEQITDGHNVDARADVFSLGKILYELLTGHLPFPMMNHSALPPKYRYVVQKATENEPDRRYSSVTALLTDLDTLIDRSGALEQPEKVVLDLCEKYAGPVPGKLKRGDFETVMRTLLENQSDYTLLVRALPKLPSVILDRAASDHPDQLRELVETYDRSIAQDITFEYCDVVADFYETLFNHCNQDPRIQTIVVRRLATLGYDYNRWHVGRTFTRVLRRVTNPGILLEIASVLEDRRAAADWLKDYVSDVPPILRKYLA